MEKQETQNSKTVLKKTKLKDSQSENYSDKTVSYGISTDI